MIFSRLLSLCLLSLLLCSFAVEAKVKYVFLFIGDGMSLPQKTLAEAAVGKKLAINHQMRFSAPTQTFSANAYVTDSAAAGTAIACGEKTKNQYLGIAADGRTKLESTAAFAKQQGYRVGILTTVTINHATPAAFYAHRISRQMYYEIGLDLITSNFDYFAGGGFADPDGLRAVDKKVGNLYKLAENAGYKLARTREEAAGLRPGQKAFITAADGTMPYSIDAAKGAWTLAELTQKGIDLLDNPKGFFMMVEGGKIDYAGHANDGASNIGETLAFDEAVKVALAFAAKHPDETLIVITGDHETGGLTLGVPESGHPRELLKQKVSGDRFAELLADAAKKDPGLNRNAVISLIEQNFGFKIGDKDGKKFDEAWKRFKSNSTKDALRAARAFTANFVLPQASSRGGISWSTGHHSALPVITSSTGAGAERFQGLLDNTDIAKKLKSLMK